jgi:hypothetical protein
MAVSHERIRELVLGGTPSDEEIIDMAHELRELRRVYRAARKHYDQGYECSEHLSAIIEMVEDFTLPVAT